jgi:deoxyribose-phosphate aldolase
MQSGAHEIDMVVNVGKVLSGDWDYVRNEIAAVNRTVTSIGVSGGAERETGILKVIFENDYLGREEIVRLCGICTEVGVAFVKTSTGYGFVKRGDGSYGYEGATVGDLRLMRESVGPGVQIKAAGGVRTLDELVRVKALGLRGLGLRLRWQFWRRVGGGLEVGCYGGGEGIPCCVGVRLGPGSVAFR